MTRNNGKVPPVIATETYRGGGAEVCLHSFLISAFGGGELSTSHPCHTTPGKAPRYALEEKRASARASVI